MPEITPQAEPFAKKSFGITNSEMFYQELVLPSYEELIAHDNSKNAITAAIFSWHLHDWLWKQYQGKLQSELGVTDQKKFKEYLFGKCPGLRIIEEVANGSKHFNTHPTSSVIGSAQLKPGYLAGPSLGFGTIAHSTVTTSDGTSLTLIGVLRECNTYWRSLISHLASITTI